MTPMDGYRIGPYLGVLGGMGPLATADFLKKLAKLTPADTDQAHVPVIARSVPQIADRSAAILGIGPSPLTALIQGVRELCAAGASLIAIPCNTAHFWYDEIQALSPIPILHIVDAVAEHLSSTGGQRSPGILATEGMLQTEIYAARLTTPSITKVIYPTSNDIEALLKPGIAAVKAGDIDYGKSCFLAASQRLQTQGADSIVMGCTEIPVALSAEDTPELELIDSTTCLARACVARWQQTQQPFASKAS